MGFFVVLIAAGTECFINVSARHCCEMRWYRSPFVAAGAGNTNVERLRLKLSEALTDF